MDEQDDIQKPESSSDAMVSRRRALQIGAAASLGAAAWAGPSVGVLGTAPAYAATCSRGLICYSLPRENVNLGSPCGGFGEMPNVSLAPSTSNGITVDLTGRCLDGNDGVQITVDGSFAAATQCQVSVRVYLQGGGSFDVTRTVGPLAAGGGVLIPFPSYTDGELPNGSLFAEISVCCSDEPSCFA